MFDEGLLVRKTSRGEGGGKSRSINYRHASRMKRTVYSSLSSHAAWGCRWLVVYSLLSGHAARGCRWLVLPNDCLVGVALSITNPLGYGDRSGCTTGSREVRGSGDRARSRLCQLGVRLRASRPGSVVAGPSRAGVSRASGRAATGGGKRSVTRCADRRSFPALPITCFPAGDVARRSRSACCRSGPQICIEPG